MSDLQSASAAMDQPSPASSRIDGLDALRGVAVLGIFVINIIGFSMPWLGFSYPTLAGGDGALNYGLWTFTEIFIEGSMRGLFSLMFGAGVILFTQRAIYPDGPIKVADLYYRRTLWLIVFGLVHAYALLMPGDILLIYGIAGLIVFPFRILSARKLALLAGFIAAGFMLHDTFVTELPETRRGLEAQAIQAMIEAGDEITDEQMDKLGAWEEETQYLRDYDTIIQEDIGNRTGDVDTVYSTNASEVDVSTEGLTWWVVDAFMMMLIGMAFYKWRIITGERSVRFYVTLAVCAYAIGLALRIWAVWNRWDADFSPLLWLEWVPYQVARIAMTIGHVGLVFVLWKFFSSSLPMRALTAAGRMALTNYISQTVIANLIFTGVGLGLYGALDRAQVYGVMIVILAAQLTFSMWWLARFRFGPLEWGWRALTYGQGSRLRK
ncbi:DUF418 domain-containing protein [Hyphococcus flavus]|uniref:DUF418 domain-containing protein n=1 Tax=Hyphococcus flavus TaxID=1866326 RepID=A0AAE9ZB25_9PROT|nr:DUF418 domain-containing protein [Hyphococcus flavus]WDI31178.1 DUF418 domain-containing protein [Hyphococcus flavus]